jgi:hypothetical protein
VRNWIGFGWLKMSYRVASSCEHVNEFLDPM